MWQRTLQRSQQRARILHLAPERLQARRHARQALRMRHALRLDLYMHASHMTPCRRGAAALLPSCLSKGSCRRMTEEECLQSHEIKQDWLCNLP